MAESVKNFVDSKLASNKVVVFSTTTCPFCKKAKEVLSKYSLDRNNYEVIELDEIDNAEEIRQYLKSITGARSVPRVFINQKFVGGGDDTVRLDQSGQLEAVLKEAGAIF